MWRIMQNNSMFNTELLICLVADGQLLDKAIKSIIAAEPMRWHLACPLHNGAVVEPKRNGWTFILLTGDHDDVTAMWVELPAKTPVT